MTDVVTPTIADLVNPDQVKMFEDMYKNFTATINDIDEVLDAAQGGRAAGKRAILNGLVSENQDAVDNAVNEFSNFLDSIEDENTRAAIYHGVVKGLGKKYDGTVESVLENLVKDVPEAPPVPEDKQKEMAEMRKILWDKVKSAREFLQMVGANPEDYPLPKTRRGGRGKRGARAISQYTWSLDGEKLTGDADSLLAISKSLGFEKKSQLTALMKASPGKDEAGVDIPGLNLTDPPDPIDFVLSVENSPDGREHSLHGVRKVVNEEANEDDEDDEDEVSEDE